MLSRNVDCPLPTGLRADFSFRMQTTFLSISKEMLQIQQSKPDISHMKKGVSTEECGIEAAPHL